MREIVKKEPFGDSKGPSSKSVVLQGHGGRKMDGVKPTSVFRYKQCLERLMHFRRAADSNSSSERKKSARVSRHRCGFVSTRRGIALLEELP